MWTKRFWRTLLFGLPIFLFALHEMVSAAPPRPGFPQPGRRFVAEYAPVKSSIAHTIYYHGLFGFDRAIRASEIVLVGSPHIELGISARRLARLTGSRVFNLGLGCGESPVFALDVLQKNHANGKRIIVDSFTLPAPNGTRCAREAKQSDLFQAYATVFQDWAEFTFDWIADPLFPRFALRNGRLELGRFLAGLVVINNWHSGGAAQVWTPDRGLVFGPDAALSCPSGFEATTFPALAPDGIYSVQAPAAFKEKAAISRSATIATLVPFVLHPADVALLAKRLWFQATPANEAEMRLAFVPISATGLCTYDTGHLAYRSSLALTDRLASTLKSRW